MKIIEMKLNNFRQFYGETPSILFATDRIKNITILHGNNGSGKTAFLNAFTWLLYESFTEALQAPENIVNIRAIKEATINSDVSCWVKLLFEHNGKKYLLTRTQFVHKLDADNNWVKQGDSILELQWADVKNGEWEIERNCNDVIGRIMPKELHRYFFLDGERIEALQRPDKKNEVISATKMFIGEEILIRAIRHLKLAGNKLEDELKRLGDHETQTLINDKEVLTSEVNRHNSDIAIHKENIEGLKKQINGIEESLRSQENVQELQKRRDDLKSQETDLVNSQEVALSELSNNISSNGYRIYLKSAVNTFLSILSELEKRGELPSSIKAPFVQELLDRGKCICGSDLVVNHECYNKVKEWLSKSGISAIEEKAIRMSAEVQVLERDLPKVIDRIDREQNTLTQCKDQLSKIEEELDKISDQLKGSAEENIRDLETKKDEAEDAIDSEKRSIVLLEEKIMIKLSRIAEITCEITKRESKNSQHELAKKRFSACNQSIDILEQVQELLRESFRQDLNDRIRKIFTDISFKPYIPLLDMDYSLKLLESEGSNIVVGASTGENQILSFAFIGAIIEQAKIFSSKKDRLPSPDNSQFPIILDSTFGNLDPIYRRHIASKIPLIANQVILLISKSQWQGEVNVATRDKIGKEYVIEYYSPKSDATESTIELHGNVYNLVKRTSDDYETVKIVEVI